MHINYWTELKKNKFGRVGLGIILVLVIIAVTAPWIAPYDPFAYVGKPLEPPTEAHILGLNDIGQDIFSELLFGTRTTLMIGTGVAALSTLLSIGLGLAAALWGGWVERFILRLIDTMLIIPVFLIAILVSVYIKPGIISLIFLLTCLLWPPGTRIIYTQSLSLKQKQHLTAANNFGAEKGYLIFRHLIPDLYPLITVNFIQVVRRTIFMEAGLAFLGVFDPALKSWGLMLHYAGKFIFTGAWVWWLLPSGLIISFTLLGFALVGYGLESALDPRLRRQINAGH